MSGTVFLQAWMIVCGTIAFVATVHLLRRVLELRHERRAPLALDGLEQRLERIEVTVEATAVEVERITEANRFMAKLLADHSAVTPPAARPERVITPH
jgi:hypothetical protein